MIDVTVDGRANAQHRAPRREVGASLDARAVHTPARPPTTYRVMAATTTERQVPAQCEALAWKRAREDSNL
jgi:hypothetical protein